MILSLLQKTAIKLRTKISQAQETIAQAIAAHLSWLFARGEENIMSALLEPVSVVRARETNFLGQNAEYFLKKFPK